jgi:single-strand DNA-binding protein
MANFNKVILMGNLTRDPELRYTPSGMAVCDLNMAINRRFRTQDGQDHEDTCFVSVTVWGKQAESSGKYLSKGSPLMVEGRLKYDTWEKDGQKHSRLTVVAERVQFLSSPRSSTEFRDGAGAPSGGTQSPAPKPVAPDSGVNKSVAPDTGAADNNSLKEDDEDLPF